MKVTKMHGLGNNYIYVSGFEVDLSATNLPVLARTVSDVRKGIGSDGLVLICPSSIANIRMRIFNADGSEAENCGNALRCVAKYAYEHGYVTRTDMSIETNAGLVHAYVRNDGRGEVDNVTVDMGVPRFGASAVGLRPEHAAVDGVSATIQIGDRTFTGDLVSMGNPHFVQFVSDSMAAPVAEVGPYIERHAAFPNRINVEFVTVKDRTELDFRVWERGSGITYACGTGACAGVAAGVRRGLLANRVTVHLLGGDLEIEEQNDRIFMTGEAVEVLSGDYSWDPEESGA